MSSPSFPFTSCLHAFNLTLVIVAFFFLAPLVRAVPHPIIPSLSSTHEAANSSTTDSLHAVTFAVPCPGCFDRGADAALPFELIHSSSKDCESAVLRLNGHDVLISFQDKVSQNFLQITTADQTVGLSVQGYCDQDQSDLTLPPRQVLFFDVDPQDGTQNQDLPSFTALLNQSAQVPAVVIPHPASETQCLSSHDELALAANFFSTEGDDDSSENGDDDLDAIDTQEESPEDSPVAELRRRLTKERKLIRRLSVDCHDQRRQLFEELSQCKHDFKCSSKVLCEHVHDIFADLMATLKSHLQSSPMVSDERHWQAIINDEKHPNYGTADASPPIASSTSTSTSSSSSFVERSKKSPLLLALEILAGVLGIAGLCALIRRHCRSIRRRVDRLADREERKRAREYRCLARREAARKRWVTFKAFFRLPGRKGACEEKRALILEAAAPAISDGSSLTDIEQAWDAVMRASPNELITGVEQFATNYRVVLGGPSGSSRSKHGDALSRSSSLPSYESEKLPEYSSQPDDDVLIVDGFRVYTPSLTDCSTNTGLTPDSSIPDLSPRCSGETLRTLMSRD